MPDGSMHWRSRQVAPARWLESQRERVGKVEQQLTLGWRLFLGTACVAMVCLEDGQQRGPKPRSPEREVHRIPYAEVSGYTFSSRSYYVHARRPGDAPRDRNGVVELVPSDLLLTPLCRLLLPRDC